jgi:cytochrome c-type biogenesis protein CcmH
MGLAFSLLLLLSFGAPATALVWQDVAGELMSPACPGRTLLNCTSGQSEQWRQLIRQKVEQGESKDESMRYFVEMRGEEILAAPPKKGFALTAYLLPLFVVLNGAGLILVLTFRWVRRQPRTEPTSPIQHAESDSTEQTVPDPYRQRLLRELEDV